MEKDASNRSSLFSPEPSTKNNKAHPKRETLLLNRAKRTGAKRKSPKVNRLPRECGAARRAATEEAAILLNLRKCPPAPLSAVTKNGHLLNLLNLRNAL